MQRIGSNDMWGLLEAHSLSNASNYVRNRIYETWRPIIDNENTGVWAAWDRRSGSSWVISAGVEAIEGFGPKRWQPVGALSFHWGPPGVKSKKQMLPILIVGFIDSRAKMAEGALLRFGDAGYGYRHPSGVVCKIRPTAVQILSSVNYGETW